MILIGVTQYLRRVIDMGKEFFCDMCRAKLPLATSLQEIKIGDKVAAEVCITCGSELSTGIQQQKAAAATKMAQTQAEIAGQPAAPPTAPPAEGAPPEAPPEAEAPPAPEPNASG